MANHPSKEELSGFLLGQLAPDTCEAVAEHIEQCPPCQQTIQTLESHEDTLAELLRRPSPVQDDERSQEVVEKIAAIVDRTNDGLSITSADVSQAADKPLTSITQAKTNIPPREAFERALKASGVLDDDEWQRLLADVPAIAKAVDAAELGRALVQHGTLTKFQATLLYQGKTGLRMGEYIVLDQIGAGGMGQVFKARHRRMDRVVALKVLAKSAMKDVEAVKRFQREVKAAAKLNHPNIVTAHDAGDQDGVHFLVMEFVAGQDLSQLVKQHGPLPIDKVVSFMLQAARGLAFAHSKGVVHRDIKPANLLLDAEGTVKILDMGLARLDGDNANLAALDGLTQSGQVMGTVDYMAPEQAFDTRTADAKADVYSLGCTLHRLITGRNAFDGETLVQKILAHCEQPIPALESPHGSVPAAFEAIYRRMMAKKPEVRPTMAEVATELESIHKAATVGRAAERSTPNIVVTPHKAATAGRGVRGSDRGRRPPLKYLAAAAGAAALLFFGVWLIIRDKDGKTVAEVDAAPGTKVHVPAGGSVEVATQPATPKSSAPPTVTTPSTPATQGATTTPNILKTSVASGSPTTSAAPSVAPSADYALRFAHGASVEVPTLSDAIDPAGTLTVECWLTPGYYLHNQPEVAGSPLVKRDGEVPCLGAHGGPFYVCINNSGNFDFRLFTNEILTGGRGGVGDTPLALAKPGEQGSKFTYIGGGYNVAKQQPIHLACVRSQAKAQFYVAGKLHSSKDLPLITLAKSKEPFRIGGKVNYEDRWFHGVINEVRVSKTVRYDKDFTPPTRFDPDQNTTALYHFDEATGDVLHDASGNNHHGKIVGAKWVRANGNTIPAPVPSSNDYALKFGDGATVELPGVTAALEMTGPITIEAWVTPHDAVTKALVPVIGVGAGGIGLHLADNRWGFNGFWVKPPVTSGNYYISVPASRGAEKLRRTHVAGVRTDKQFLVFVDGQLIGSQDVPPAPLKRFGLMKLAGVPESDKSLCFKGLIDEVRFSHVARYEKPFTPQQQFDSDNKTLALYHFDEGTGDVLRDSSGNKHDGKIVGATWVRADGSAIPSASMAAVPTTSPGREPGDNVGILTTPARWNTPAFQQWLAATQKLPAEQQLAEFSKKLMELNPGFDGKLFGGYESGSSKPVVENGVVTGVGFDTAKVADISPVRVFSGLRDLSCGANIRINALGPKGILVDLSPLEGMQLTSLRIGNVPVVDLSPLRGMQLKSLGIYATNVNDLTPLVGMPLEELAMNGANKVNNLGPLRGMPLKRISMNQLPISDLTPLTGMKLNGLQVALTQVADISVLRGMPLKFIDLGGTKVTDLAPLRDCAKLETVLLSRVNIAPAEISKLLQAVPECKVEFSTPSGLLPATDALQEVDPERRVARWVLARGGTVSILRPGDERSRGIALENDLPTEPFLVVHLKIPGSSNEISAAEWQTLGGLHFVRSIDVSGCRPTNEALAAIGRCRSLENLVMAFHPSFNDAGLQHLVDLPHLVLLDISSGGHTAASLESLGKLTSLRVLKMGTKDLQGSSWNLMARFYPISD
jgi:tRNA A-37 threonylcarbamoyl transferase component Bud32